MRNKNNNINNGNGLTENKIRKVLFSEITILIMIIGFVSGIIWFFAGTSQDIALIQKDIKVINENHMTHIQGFHEELVELKKEDQRIEENYQTLNNNIIKIMTTLGIK